MVFFIFLLWSYSQSKVDPFSSIPNYTTLKKNQTDTGTLVFYNVKDLKTPKYHSENLVYQFQIEDIVLTLLQLDPKGPDLIGLSEIDEDKNIQDLIQSLEKKTDSHYSYIMTQKKNPYLKSLNIAFIYKKDCFSLENYSFLSPSEKSIRDILHIQGLYKDSSLHLFINHWLSRVNNNGFITRKESALFLRDKIKELSDPFIVLGDFNDEPQDDTIKNHLNAKLDPYNDDPQSLVNITFSLSHKQEGSYYFKNQWYAIDQIMVSKSLLLKESNIKASLPIYYKKNVFHDPIINNLQPPIGYSSDHRPIAIILYR